MKKILLAATASLALLLTCNGPVQAQGADRAASAVRSADDSPSSSRHKEKTNKAASLFNFLGYAEWPAGSFGTAQTPYRMGIFGDDRLLGTLQQMAHGRQVEGRPVQIIRLTPDSPLSELSSLHFLFIGQGESARLPQLAKRLEKQPVLIVTESPGALKQGSAINLCGLTDKIQFEVSLAAAEQRGIQLSSRMLPIAMSVETRAP